MRAALGDPDLFGRVFAGESWAAWRVLLIAAMGEALTKLERIVFESGGLCEVAGARVGRHGRRPHISRIERRRGPVSRYGESGEAVVVFRGAVCRARLAGEIVERFEGATAGIWALLEAWR